MELTIREINEKFIKIGDAERIVESHIPMGSFEAHEPLYQVLDVLKDYEAMLYELKVHI